MKDGVAFTTYSILDIVTMTVDVGVNSHIVKAFGLGHVWLPKPKVSLEVRLGA